MNIRSISFLSALCVTLSGCVFAQQMPGAGQGTLSKDQLQCLNRPNDPGCQEIGSPELSNDRNAAAPARVPQIRTLPEDQQYQYQDQQNVYPQRPANTDVAKREPPKPVKPETEFQQLVADSVGRPLPIFGQSLFSAGARTFAPLTRVDVPNDYVIGPGDELQIRIWGSVEADLRTTVDRAGQIYIPHVGLESVAGVHFSDLAAMLRRDVSKVYRNFELSVNVGRIRSIQVFVMGQAKVPGTYTISSLSTLVNAIFESGGPNSSGSLRRIELRRDGKTLTQLDLYDLLLHGDKSKDVKLQSGDVVFIPPVGALAAISGSVNVPAIYELLPGSTIAELIEDAGGTSAVADNSKLTIERISDKKTRVALAFPISQESEKFALQDGDIVQVLSIVPSLQDSVTLRGNVSNPGHFPWKPGMRVHDLIPDAQMLLTRDYWIRRAAITNGKNTEYPVGKDQDQKPTGETKTKSEKQAADEQLTAEQLSTHRKINELSQDLHKYAPEINWHYATIQRTDPVTLETSLIPFDLDSAISGSDQDQNKELKPGDIVTIFSQEDISVPQDQRTRYVTIEGEVKRPGIYKLGLGDTLPVVLSRAGGITQDGYIYGTMFTRESARVDQQKSLDQLVENLDMQLKLAGVAAANRGDATQDQAGRQAVQESVLSSLRRLQASGRIVLGVGPKSTAYPTITLEDQDRMVVPHRPNTVSVLGVVYNPASFIWDPKMTVGNYLKLAGKGKPNADTKHTFILHADGSVSVRASVNGAFSGDSFDRLRLHPGDQIVVPYKLNTGNFARGLREWTQITSQLALSAASLAIIAKQ